MHIIVGSKNPVKIAAAKTAFTLAFPHIDITVEGISVSSGVSDQPMSAAETLQGAENRASNIFAAASPDFAVGMEGGLEEDMHGLASVAWMVIKNRAGKTGRGKSGVFFLPPGVAELVRKGHELGEADDLYWGETNSKQQDGAVGLLTNQAVRREDYYVQALLFALIPFIQKDHYE
ncbi:MAG: inosine/xanthosine triphosphatase [Candidatus Magasanikbacteria bacterium CG10_big_fil_rev_8_21_14_0_10_43_6]|uniref:Probable inosine/xanthosine triphosphatase n=1 Tax=Candidatus Magasanikbacteria bacterium CG10_big_fil_rev_8_21_14_0_10_43_6 TaxID=1974650 RepID=A0A2M6W142_9BACT|nr:MAG: inosine/xanthosine triphosphatase [Candidatus Magasanikbacteria bacterium CG10_big_fil_rev_8_21_14_0_10_43_6]